MISADARPRLAAKARLRWDRRGGRFMLLYPERGLALNATAADIVRLCTGERTVRAIVDELATTYGQPSRDAVERQVLAFLARMEERGLIRDADA